jgi:hypothetical protein
VCREGDDDRFDSLVMCRMALRTISNKVLKRFERGEVLLPKAPGEGRGNFT